MLKVSIIGCGAIGSALAEAIEDRFSDKVKLEAICDIDKEKTDFLTKKLKTKPEILSIDEIKKISEELKRNGKKIVTINGAFDILHIGHIKILNEAKAQGDILIVGLNSDSSVKINKGTKRPINNENDRATMLTALEVVDYVTHGRIIYDKALLDLIYSWVNIPFRKQGVIRDNPKKEYSEWLDWKKEAFNKIVKEETINMFKQHGYSL